MEAQYTIIYLSKKISAIYTPLNVSKNNFDNTMSNLKLFKVQGCSVSMPYKTKVIQYIDKLNSIARNTKSVNTILNKNDILFGFNTDYYGIKKSIEKIKLNRNESSFSYFVQERCRLTVFIF